MTSEPDAGAHWWREASIVRWLGMIVCAGAVLRVSVMLDLSGLPYFERPLVDAAIFERGATRIAAGDLVLAEQIEGMNPGYFYVLGAVYALGGDGPWAIRLLQIVLGLVTIVLVFDAARRVLGGRWALMPAAIAATYVPAMYFEQQLLGETVALTLHAGALAALLGARDRPTMVRFAVLGALIGAAALLRPTALLLLGPAAVAALVTSRHARVRSVLAVAVGACIAIAPITVRNVIAIGEPVLIASHGGINAWIGNGAHANGAFRIPDETPGADSPGSQFRAFRETASREVGRELSVSETDRYWTVRTLSWISANPWTWMRLMLRKLHLFWNARELSDVYRYEFLYDRSTALQFLPRFGWIAPVALIGLFAALRMRGHAARWIAGVALLECVGVVLMIISARYRLTAVAPLLVLAGLGAKIVVDTVRAQDAKTVAALACAVAIAGAVVWPVRVRDTRSVAWRELGEAWAMVGETPSAIDAYQTALEHDGNDIRVIERLADVLERTGEVDEARAHWLVLERLQRERGDLEAAAAARDRAHRPTVRAP